MTRNNLNFGRLLILPLFLLFVGVNGAQAINEEEPHNDHAEEVHAADAHGEHEEEEGIGEKIIHHIKDAHNIHLWGHTSIYLPVIAYTDRGLDIFSSKNLYDAEHHKEGVVFTTESGNSYLLSHEALYLLNAGETAAHWNHETHKLENGTKVALDLSITKNVVGIFLTLIVLFLIFPRVAGAYRKRQGQAPRGLQNLIESLVLFVRDQIAKPSIGHSYERYMPFLLTTFFFIWIANLLGLIPFLGGLNVTGNMAVTAVLATIVFIITTIKGNKHYWTHIMWPAGVPAPIKLILVPIEILGIFIKPFVLMVRLTANITAGHIIILAFASLIFIFSDGGEAVGTGYGVGVGATAFMIFMNTIELLVAFLQAFVFTLLAAIYFGQAVEEAHH